MKQDYRAFHEAGFLTDILNMMSASGVDYVADIGNKILGRNKRSPGNFTVDTNIAKAASALTAVFPVIVTEATSLDQAVMVSKAIERKCVALLQMLFAANQITTATGAHDYLRQFHSNISKNIDLSGMDVDDVIEYSNKLSESVHENPELNVQRNIAIDAVLEDTRDNINYVLSSDINDIPLNSYIISKPTVANLNEYTSWRSNNTSTTTTTTTTGTNNTIGGMFGLGNGDSEIRIEKRTDNEPSVSDIKNAYEMLNKGVIKTDVQKANEAVPSLIIVNFTSVMDGQAGEIINTCVIGVKAVIRYVSSEEMINRIVLKNSDRRQLLDFIRATTREISFFKDFLFAVDRAKVDAVAKSGRGSSSKIWKLLELRANRAKLNKASGKRTSDTSAITTIVISRAEVDLIKKQHRIDLLKPGTLLSIMKGYNLMCAVIVDEVAERCDFMYDDGSSSFETLSFTALEREDSNGMYKKVINLMAKGR